MKPKTHPIKKSSDSSGFALIATISLMVLLLILALGMLSLSAVELRSSGTTDGREISRANARTALIIALGELQELTGPDTRVTAPANALAGNGTASPFVTGVWRSWEGGDHDSQTGLPEAPDYDLKKDTFDEGRSSDARFLGWLLSGPQKDNDAGDPPVVDSQSGGAVKLLSERTLGSNSGKEVFLVPTKLNETGSYAWWVQGENQKALIEGIQADPTDDAGWSQRLASNSRPDTEGLGFTDDTELTGAVSRQSLNLAANADYPPASNPKVAGVFYHDITATSRGLLTNTANGGWRRDLSLMAEKWADGMTDPSTGLANDISNFQPDGVFSLNTSFERKADLRIDNSGDTASIYPWATATGRSMSWNALAEYVALYKRVKNKANGTPFFDTYTHLGDDRLNLDLIPARLHWTFGFSATQDGNQDKYTPGFAFKPTATIWNPYNVALEAPQKTEMNMARFDSGLNQTFFPINLNFKIDDSGAVKEYTPTLGILLSNNNAGVRNSRQIMGLDSSVEQTWRPGETRVFGLSNTTFEARNNNAVINMDPGLNTLGGLTRGLAFQALGSNPPPADFFGRATAKYTVELELNDTGGSIDTFTDYRPNRGRKNEGVGVPGQNFESRLRLLSTTADAVAADMVPPVENVDETLGSAENDPTPFINVLFTLRVLDGSKFPTKGYINTKPLVSLTRGASGDETFNQSSYEWVITPSAGWDSPGTPEASPLRVAGVDQNGYVGTDYTSSGIPFWSVAELPTQPLLSLAELQHFDAGYNNPLAPRVANAIGNSHATPDIAPDEVTRVIGAGTGYDHSYVGNHLFFDDWFLSSITPDVAAYSASVNRELEDVYADHLRGDEPLRNRQYKPSVSFSGSDADDEASSVLDEDDSWRDIASKLEVEGMFNVNSTSVQAWEALLKSSRGTSVPEIAIGADGSDDWDIDLDQNSGIASSRTTVATDPNTDTPRGDLVAKHPELTDQQIERLAEEIVEQIKLRGPFLSLSEFVNRQLSNDTELALAGTVEMALINLSKLSGAENPFTDIQAAYTVQAQAASTTVFDEAAEGNVAYGMPGWIRQADVLRPLAPILSARDDTFTIRAYGDARDSSDNVVARSWCEAVVQRKASYVDQTDEATTVPDALSAANQRFGRKFEIISFRWLSPDEI